MMSSRPSTPSAALRLMAGIALGGIWFASQPTSLSAQEGGSALDVPTFPSAGMPFDRLSDPSEEAEGDEITPGGAFLRSLVLPGWGHAVTGSPTRGAFYFTAQAGTAWMLGKSIQRRREARRFREEEARIVRSRHQAAGVSSPDSLNALVRLDQEVGAWDALIDSRSQQVEDWVALGIFLALLGATDAFVAGHLMDRPEPLTFGVAPRPEGGWQFSASLRRR